MNGGWVESSPSRVVRLEYVQNSPRAKSKLRKWRIGDRVWVHRKWFEDYFLAEVVSYDTFETDIKWWDDQRYVITRLRSYYTVRNLKTGKLVKWVSSSRMTKPDIEPYWNHRYRDEYY